MPGGWEWLIIIGVLVLLFGAKRLPEMARSVGQSARVFKGEMKGLRDDEGHNAPPQQQRAAELPPAGQQYAGPVTGQQSDGQQYTGQQYNGQQYNGQQYTGPVNGQQYDGQQYTGPVNAQQYHGQQQYNGPVNGSSAAAPQPNEPVRRDVER